MLTSPLPFCSAQIARNISATYNTVVTNALINFSVNLDSAINNGLYTLTYALAGVSPLDVQVIMGTLTQLGYTVSISGPNLTATW